MTRKKRCKKYFFSRVLLLILLVNTGKMATGMSTSRVKLAEAMNR